MTNQEIYEKAKAAGVGCELDGETVRYYETFDTSEDEYPHDVSWSRYCHAQEDLAEVGLTIVEFESDNDSCMGVIVEKTKE